MIYIVTIYCDGQVYETREVHGMAEVERIQAIYENTNFDVDFEPDAFRYLRMNRSEALS